MVDLSKVIVVINSSNRAGKVRTHDLFPKELNWIVAVPIDQVEDYRAHYEKYTTVLGIPDNVPQYLPSQRQYVMESIHEKYEYIWLMDDDLTFFRRKKGDTALKRCKKKHIKKMLGTMCKHLTDVPMVGISTRLGNNREPEPYKDITRVTRCYALNRKVFNEVGATFAPFEPFVAEDFHMALCFLNKGHPNRVIYSYAQEDIGSNAEGGCSQYRTADVQRTTSFWMTDNHPEVTIKTKSSANWDIDGKGEKNYRVDMIVQWKKAYKPQKERKAGGLNDRLKRLQNK